MKMHSKDRLAAELHKAGLGDMAIRAANGYYHDFLSPIGAPCKQLADDLAAAGTPEALALRARHLDGEFDATKEESDAWVASPEGRATIARLSPKTRAVIFDDPDFGEIPPEFHAEMNELARRIDRYFNPQIKLDPPGEKTVAFFLTCFPFNTTGRFNYISNADKLDVKQMLKDIVARIEARERMDAAGPPKGRA